MSLNLRSKLRATWQSLETLPEIPESFGEAQLQNHMAVSGAEDDPSGHEEDHKEWDLALHFIQPTVLPKVYPWGHV